MKQVSVSCVTLKSFFPEPDAVQEVQRRRLTQENEGQPCSQPLQHFRFVLFFSDKVLLVVCGTVLMRTERQGYKTYVELFQLDLIHHVQ